MTMYYGPWEYGGSGNGMRVAIDVTTSRAYHTSSSVTFTVKYYTQNRWRYNDYQFMTRTGQITGQFQYNNTSGTNSSGGGLILRSTRTYTYNYGSSSYGSSPGTRTFGCRVTGAYNGVTPSVSRSVRIPARPYARPASPSNINVTRPTRERLYVTWDRNATSGEPYTSQLIRLRHREEGGSSEAWTGWYNEATVSGGATSYTKNGLGDNRVYEAAVRAQNSAGNSAFAYADTPIGTKPASPDNVRASLRQDGSVYISWSDPSYDPASGYSKDFRIQRSTDGGAWSNVAGGVSRTNYSDTTAPGGTNQYRVRVEHSTPPGDFSDWGTSNPVQTQVPPLAPTELSPDGTSHDLDDDLTLTWQHNDGGDGAEQSAYEIEVSDDGGTTWTALASGTSTAAAEHTLTGGTLANSPTAYQWRVRTRAIVEQGFGPWSSVATLSGTDAPVVTILSPGATSLTTPLSVTWEFEQAQDLGQTFYWATLYSDTGEVLQDVLKASATDRTVVFDKYRPEDGETYTIKVRAWTEGNVYSNFASVETTLELPVPAEVFIEPTFGECSGTVALSLTSIGTGEIPPDQFNLATNPSVETDLTEWLAGFGTNTIARDTTRAWVGTASVKATWDGSNGAALHNVLNLTVGQTYTATMRVYVPSGMPLVRAGVYFGDTGETNSVFDEWQELAVTFTATETGHSIGVETVSTAPANGTFAFVDALCVVEGAERPTYFDGDTTDLPNREFSWTGTPHNSTSLSQSRLEVGAESAIVERRIDGGPWVTLIEDLPVPSEFTDPLPSTSGTTEYRVTSVSNIPSYRVNPVVAVEGPDGGWKPGAEHWGFLSYGDGFSESVRVQDDLSIKEKTSRVRGTQHFLGRAKPLMLSGDNTNRKVSVAGSLYWRDDCPEDECHYSSTPEEWTQAGLEATIVCWRDHFGRRIFGSLSEVEVNHVGLRAGTVSFEVTEADYIERYIDEETG